MDFTAAVLPSSLVDVMHDLMTFSNEDSVYRKQKRGVCKAALFEGSFYAGAFAVSETSMGSTTLKPV